MGHRYRDAAGHLGAGMLAALLALAAAACSGPAGPASSSSPSASAGTSKSAAAGAPPATTAAPAQAPASTSGGAAAAPPAWPMYHGDAAHSGLSRSMPAASGPLKVIKSIRLDGAVYASPVAADGVIVVATEHDSVYGLDASGRQLWHVSVGSPSPAYERACGNIDPLGITGTPVYSAQTGDVYLVAEHSGKVGHDLIALDLRTGQVRWRQGIDLPGPAPAAMQQRGALAIAGGRVWVSFGAQYGDCSNYKGRVVAVPLDGGAPVTYDPSPNRQGGIWNPAGPTVDAAGHLYVVSANGSTFPGAAYDHTNSVLELSPAGKLLSSFAPSDWAQDNQGDVGLGSQGVALVGAKWAVLGGKSGPVYVLRQGNLGGIGGQVSAADIGCLSFGGPAVDGDVVYLPCTDGVRAVRVDQAGTLRLLWHASGQVAGSPVIGGGRVWALDQFGGVLHALDPATGQTLEQVSVGVTSRFATPAIYGGLVLIPTLAGVTYVQAG